jgi:hypothetical protein
MKVTQVAVPLLLLAMIPASAATLEHVYNFQNSLADSLGGPNLTSLGGTIGATSYTFGAQQGLSLSGALLNDDSYSIFMNFEFDTLTGFRKIVDFKDLASDNGLYNLSTALNYYNFATGPTGVFTPGVFAAVTITRDSSTGLVVGYVNGVPEISFTDSSSDAVFNAANNIINFFQDDSVTGGRESSSGAVNKIEIFDGALSAAEVAALTPGTPTPEPVSFGLAGLGLLALSAVRRFRA